MSCQSTNPRVRVKSHLNIFSNSFDDWRNKQMNSILTQKKRDKKNSGPLVEKEDFGFKVPSKYKIIRLIGVGTFAQVCCAKNMETGEKVAIKKIYDIFRNNGIDAKHTLREIRLLKQMKHENIIGLKELILPQSTDFNDVYIVLELMSSDLSKITNSGVPLTLDHLKTFLYQMLRGLKYIHSLGIVHRDLKPNNILVNDQCDLKIADFGTGRQISVNLTLMESVTTRWYIAPEGLFSSTNYDKAVDVWSVGCIVAELIGGKTLFPGKENLQQIEYIVNILGTPSKEDLDSIGNIKMNNYIKELPIKHKVPFQTLFPTTDSQAIDLLEKMLLFNPKKRITVEKALEHPFLAELHDIDDEPVASSFLQEDSQSNGLSKKEFQELIYKEIENYSVKS